MWLVSSIVALLSFGAAAASSGDELRLVQKISIGDKPVTALVQLPGVAGTVALPSDDADSTGSDQVLTTSVQDPGHPEEPWVVTTYRRPDESYPAFIKRHRDTVNAVRDALQEAA